MCLSRRMGQRAARDGPGGGLDADSDSDSDSNGGPASRVHQSRRTVALEACLIYHLRAHSVAVSILSRSRSSSTRECTVGLARARSATGQSRDATQDVVYKKKENRIDQASRGGGASAAAGWGTASVSGTAGAGASVTGRMRSSSLISTPAKSRLFTRRDSSSRFFRYRCSSSMQSFVYRPFTHQHTIALRKTTSHSRRRRSRARPRCATTPGRARSTSASPHTGY